MEVPGTSALLVIEHLQPAPHERFTAAGALPTTDNGQGELSVPTQPVYIDSVTIDEKT